MNAFAVVGNANQIHAAVHDINFDARRERIDAVFQQLLHHAGRTFNHFPGGYAVDNVSIQLLNSSHIRASSIHKSKKRSVRACEV